MFKTFKNWLRQRQELNLVELRSIQNEISHIRQENFLDLSMLDSFVRDERGKLLQELYAKERRLKRKLGMTN